MNSLDKIVSESIRNNLEKDLGKHTFKKIEKMMDEYYGITVTESINDLSKLDLILRKFFGANAVKKELNIFRKILIVEKNKSGKSDIIIKDPEISYMIFRSYGNPDKKLILDSLTMHPKSISNIITKIDLRPSSTYKHAKELIRDGLLTMIRYSKASDGRKVKEYVTTLNRVIFDIQNKNIKVTITLETKHLQDSFVYNSIIKN